MKLKIFIVLAIFCICTLPRHVFSINHSDTKVDRVTDDEKEFDESLIKVRLRKLNSSFDIRYTPEVKKFLQSYIKSYRGTSELLLGRATIYFQYFDQALQKYNLPSELKMISVLESSLNPNAISPAGAIGLWQFMPATAKDMGLNFNSIVDERRDPDKSADAAARYFLKLYSIFEDWNLTLAAYNCGPNRVQNAIDAAGGVKDFWAIRKYLPKETQNYIPKFIAISYMFNFYTLHNLKPSFPELDLQITDLTSLYSKVDLKALSGKLGVSYDVMKVLNPMYRQGYIPASDNPMNIILPLRYMNSFKNSIPRPDSKMLTGTESSSSSMMDANDYYEMTYTVGVGEKLDGIAGRLGINSHLIRMWNGMNNNSIKEGQLLKLYILRNKPLDNFFSKADVHPLTEQFVRVKTMMEDENFIKISYLEIGNDDVNPAVTSDDFIYHRLDDRESISDLVNQYPGTTIQSIVDLNGFSKDNLPKPGDLIKIKKK